MLRVAINGQLGARSESGKINLGAHNRGRARIGGPGNDVEIIKPFMVVGLETHKDGPNRNIIPGEGSMIPRAKSNQGQAEDDDAFHGEYEEEVSRDDCEGGEGSGIFTHNTRNR